MTMGEYDGLDLQTITKRCHCGDGLYRGYPHSKERPTMCYRCNGSGIYDTREIILYRYLYRDQLWHIPTTYTDWHITEGLRSMVRNHIRGYVRHGYTPGWKGIWATLYLLAWFDRRNLRPFWCLSFNEWWFWKKRKFRWKIETVRSYFSRLLKIKDKENDEIPF